MGARILRALCAAVMLLSAVCTWAKTDAEARRGGFCWGTGISGNIEMAGHDMSTLGVYAEMGWKWRWIRFAGINMEANAMATNSSRTFPLSLCLRTDFSSRPRTLFADLRGGIAFNRIDGYGNQKGAYGSGGLGITLTSGKSCSSHLVVGYTYIGRDKCRYGNREEDCLGMHYATMRLGLSF